jgi:hypothetical protein
MTWRSLIVRGRGHVSDVIQILQSDWSAIPAASLLTLFRSQKPKFLNIIL